MTIYLLSGWMGKSYPVLNPFSHSHGHLWLVLLGLADSKTAMTVLHVVTNVMIFCGLYVMQNGWVLIQWPSLPTLVMWPILAFAYYRLAMREEKDVERQFGQAWRDYKARVPAFIPNRRRARRP